MIKSATFQNKEFNSKEELFKELKDNERKLIELKKASIQNTAEKGQLSTFELLKSDENIKEYLDVKDGFVYAVINTTKFLDSHDDVHLNGIWNKSVKEQQGKILYVTDHTLKVDSVIAWNNDVEMYVKEVPFSYLGKGYEGTTEALIFAINKDKIVHEKAKQIIEEKRPVQNSVRMEYVKIELAINSDNPDYKENKKVYDTYINEIANRELANENGYFWAVTEAKIIKEGSMVLFGSNEVTPIIQENKTEADTITSETIEPAQVTQTNKRKLSII